MFQQQSCHIHMTRNDSSVQWCAVQGISLQCDADLGQRPRRAARARTAIGTSQSLQLAMVFIPNAKNLPGVESGTVAARIIHLKGTFTTNVSCIVGTGLRQKLCRSWCLRLIDANNTVMQLKHKLLSGTEKLCLFFLKQPDVLDKKKGNDIMGLTEFFSAPTLAP